MGTRQRNRLVSAIAAKQQLPSRRGFPGTRTGKPNARDPPLPRLRTYRNLAAAPGERPPTGRAANEERAMREHHPLSTSDSRS